MNQSCNAKILVEGKFAYLGGTKPTFKQEKDPETGEIIQVKIGNHKSGQGRWFRFPYLHVGTFENNNLNGPGTLYQKQMSIPGKPYDFKLHDTCEADYERILNLPESELVNRGYEILHKGVWKSGFCCDVPKAQSLQCP